MKRLFKRCYGTKRATALSSIVVVLVTATAAWAAWLLTAPAVPFKTQTGSLATVTFNAYTAGEVGTTLASGGKLMPGGTANLFIHTVNPNPVGVTTRTIANSVITNDQVATCPNTNFSMVPAAFAGVAVPTGTSDLIIPGGISLSATAPGGASGSGCSGANVTATLDLTYGIGS
jgi:hypothetical protein